MYVNKIGRLNASNKSSNGYPGVRYGVKKSSGKLSYKSIELHSPHKRGHQVWHWQKNQWSYYNNSWNVSSKKSVHWSLLFKRL